MQHEGGKMGAVVGSYHYPMREHVSTHTHTQVGGGGITSVKSVMQEG